LRTHLANLTCGCIAGYFDNGTSSEMCSPCHYSCASCWGTNTLCLTCNPLHKRYLTTTGNLCPCDDGFYDNGVPLCPPCHSTCVTCNGPLKSNCLSCNIVVRALVGSSCVCGFRFYDLNDVCTACSYTCLTCTAATPATCTSCNSAAFRTFSAATGTCPCNPGYYDAGA
jgi:hypothetical protein